jgi:hypothetical protein
MIAVLTTCILFCTAAFPDHYPTMRSLALQQKRKMAGDARVAVRSKFLTTILVLFAVASLHPAAAQVVIPHGDFDSDFEKYLVATISFVLLCLAAWQFYRNRR